MAGTNPKVMAWVERALAKNPDMPGDELYDGAKGVDKSIGKLTRRQFHAKYPLQVKRKANAGKPKTKAKTKRRASTRKKSTAPRARRSASRTSTAPRAAAASGGVARDAIRGSLLSFALELASADDGDLMKVMSGVDQYVDQIMGHMG